MVERLINIYYYEYGGDIYERKNIKNFNGDSFVNNCNNCNILLI